MKKVNVIIAGVFGLFIIVACQPQTDLEKLEAKKATLKSELAALEEQIQAQDTSKSIFLPLVVADSITFGRFEHKVNVQGEVKTDEEIMVNAEANGMISRINVKEGQFVRKGQSLAELDSEIIESNAEELKTAIEFAEYAYEKQEALFKKGVGTEFELKQAKNQLNTLRSQLNTLQTQKSKYVVTAPFDGYIDEIMVRKGEMASAQSPILRLVNNTDMRLTANISEYYYTKIGVGTALTAFIPTLNKKMNLEVTSVGTYIHPTNRTFKIQADVSEQENLLPNMLAEINVTDLVLDSVYIVPARALVKSQDNKDFVFLINENKQPAEVEYVQVKILSRHEGKAAVKGITKELNERQRVVVEGARGVTNGDPVRIR